MIEASNAVKSAAQFWRKLLEDPDVGEALPNAKFRVEEVECADNLWSVTLSVNRPRGDNVMIQLLVAADAPREYKHFEIDGETGQVKSMRMGSLKPVGQ